VFRKVTLKFFPLPKACRALMLCKLSFFLISIRTKNSLRNFICRTVFSRFSFFSFYKSVFEVLTTTGV
jgi:hypothetical protein